MGVTEGIFKLPKWWMRHGYQRVDMEKNALRAATATRQEQIILVPAEEMKHFGMDPDNGNDWHYHIHEGETWVVWKVVYPDPNGTGAGLPGKQFPWES